ncbi:uncharacterized protein F4822DRAFT_28726 [Hypoxylon trugodes]|uniref:uncharacterized protein n=1 Tax=Hypoxylon trugodes TaxID=326681 RepID=UPI00219574B6|nr:uncharacterized protein F4822DRAFT_28726 [Hypoxylon trugodes]KAI1393880.1 hypothetical protein F4822DRAFT_28726 [Hypoxylon trugodes]
MTGSGNPCVCFFQSHRRPPIRWILAGASIRRMKADATPTTPPFEEARRLIFFGHMVWGALFIGLKARGVGVGNLTVPYVHHSQSHSSVLANKLSIARLSTIFLSIVAIMALVPLVIKPAVRNAWSVFLLVIVGTLALLTTAATHISLR